MSSRKKDYRQELGRFDIHMRNGREKFLQEVARAWEMIYPAKADWFKQQLRRQREITVEGARFNCGKGREMRVMYRVPTELIMYIQRWVPDFGRDDKDQELLSRVWCDLVRPCNDNRRRTRLYISEDFCRVKKSKAKSKAHKDKSPKKGKDACKNDAAPARSHNASRLNPVISSGVCDDNHEERPGESTPDDPVFESELRARLRRNRRT